jgi:hypothetical protein
MTMTKLSIILFTASLAVAVSCGDNLKAPDARTADTGSGSGSAFPAAPTLGTQIDRLGRPAINTALNHGFDAMATAGTAKDAYNQDGSPGGWTTAYAPEFAKNLAILDALDTGLTCVAGTCTPNGAATNGDGCGNQVLYNGNLGGGGTAALTSYLTLAGVLADDELFLDTTKASCDLANHQNYLAVEFNYLTMVNNATCGGRSPTNDVIDTSYAALAIGLAGFATADFTPAFGDTVGPHTDVSNDTFPFLGAPH